MNKKTVVVGDQFAEFATLEGAITVSKLANLFDGLTQDIAIPEAIMFGQGVSDSWLAYLKNRAQSRGLPIRFFGEQQIVERTGRRFCHKWQRHNVLITDPRKVNDTNFEMLLSIDDGCEIMADHVTGHHIQGMIFVEAARQAFLAVTEWFLLNSEEDYYFVINRLDVSYLKFAFPLPVSITFELVTTDDSRADRLAVSALVRFHQCDECVCEVRVDYTAILESKLAAKEKAMALQALGQVLGTLPAQDGVPSIAT